VLEHAAAAALYGILGAPPQLFGLHFRNHLASIGAIEGAVPS